MIHHALIKQVQQDFHMQRKDGPPCPCAVLPWHIQILAEQNKNYNTQLHINKNTQILFTTVMLELGIKGIHVTKKAAMHYVSPERTLSC